MNNFFKIVMITAGFALLVSLDETGPSSARAEVLKGHGEMHQLRSKQKDDVLARTVIGGDKAKVQFARTVIGGTAGKTQVARTVIGGASSKVNVAVND